VKKNYLLTFICSLLCTVVLSAQGNDMYDIVRSGSVDMLKELVKADPEFINRKNKDGYTPLILACYSGNAEVANYLINHSKDINSGSKYGTPLMAASVKGYDKIVDLLIDKGADVNATDPNGTTALHYAIIFGFDDVAKLLTKAKANPKLKDNRGKTALDYAKMLGKTEIVKLLSNK
tara:strand:+ start:102760 stop:103290 length:531 start_codon:yes stop_codon:yes gene_type:complete